MSWLRRLLGNDRPGATYSRLRDVAVAGLRVRTQALARPLGLPEASWEVDQEAGTLTFVRSDGHSAVCSVQIVGTYNTADGTWLWGWDHPSVRPALARSAQRVLDWSREQGIKSLQHRKLRASEEQCWEFAAIACHLDEAQGAYRGPSGQTLVFMVFDDVQLSGPDGTCQSVDRVPAGPRAGSDEVPEDARSVAMSFLEARHAWEERAASGADRHKGESRVDAAARTYATLVDRWCAPEVVPQPVSYGSPASWEPGKVAVLGGSATAGTCCIEVSDESSFGGTTHELHLRWLNGRWAVTNLLFVDEEGKWECL